MGLTAVRDGGAALRRVRCLAPRAMSRSPAAAAPDTPAPRARAELDRRARARARPRRASRPDREAAAPPAGRATPASRRPGCRRWSARPERAADVGEVASRRSRRARTARGRSAVTCCASAASRSSRHPSSTARSSATSVIGDAIATRRPMRVLDQRGIGLDRRADKGFARDEQDDEVRSPRRAAPSTLLFASASTCARTCCACRSMRGAALVRRGRLHRLEIRGERNLGVHDDLPAARQVHHHVRPLPPALALGRHLFDEVAMRAHPRQLGHSPERQLAPAPARLASVRDRQSPGLAGAARSGPRTSRLEARVGARARLLQPRASCSS
mgnify:CR=1 FL=1